jgi:hypothetical protein
MSKRFRRKAFLFRVCFLVLAGQVLLLCHRWAEEEQQEHYSVEILPRIHFTPAESNLSLKSSSALITEPSFSSGSQRRDELSDTLWPADTFRNRTLVVVLGSLRCGEAAWKSLYRNVLDVNNADLAVITQAKPKSDNSRHTVSLLQRAKYVWEVPSFTDWADALDLMAGGRAWRERVAEYYTDHESGILGGALNYSGSGAIIFWYRWFLTERIRELNWKSRYDRFVITRSDHFYLCPHDINELDPYFMWVPQGQTWGGVTDRYLVVNASNVLEALNILPPLLKNPSRYSNYLQRKVNTEHFLAMRWREQSLFPDKRNKFPRTMFVCMAREDALTSWKPLGIEVFPGVFTKYHIEFSTSQQACRMSRQERLDFIARKSNLLPT